MFRLQIQKWIVSTGRPSYLWTKYSEKNEAMIPYCFPGVEHLISEKVQAYYLIDTYKRLDTIHSSKFMIRLERVFISRNILTPGEFRAYAKKTCVITPFYRMTVVLNTRIKRPKYSFQVYVVLL